MSGRIVRAIREPGVVLLVGAAGSGKSTLAAEVFPGDAVLSSDAYREAIAGDAADQRRNRRVFEALHRQLARRLAERRLVVVDATNVTAASRRRILELAAAAGAPVAAIVLDLPAPEVRARNAARPGRRVPEDAVSRQLDQLRRTLERDELRGEGLDPVVIVGSAAELDALAIELRAAIVGQAPPIRAPRRPR